MQPKLTIQERLKDLRVERSLTLEQLSAETGISKSALGKYEADDFKDISPFSMVELAKFYGVSTDYLLGLTEQKNHPNTELDALHLGDDVIEVLKTGKFNHRLLSELICHKDFQRFMLDAEIYVDRIADMRVNNMNAVLEAVRQMALMKNGGEENDLYLRTLEVAQIREDEYFGSLIADDLKGILRDIRNEHRPDTLLRGSVAGVIVTGVGEFYTKDVARDMVFAANQAGCGFLGRPLVEATGSLRNFRTQAQIGGTDEVTAFHAAAAELLSRLDAWEKPAPIRHVLALHASQRTTSNTLALWELVKAGLPSDLGVQEICLRNGTMADCNGCSYTACLHFGEQGGCFYGGPMVDEVYPAVRKCDALVMLCANYNDALAANLTACVNRLTALFRQTRMYDKRLFGLIVSGYSGGDLLARQLISALNMNKSFYLPPRFSLLETANERGSLVKLPGIEAQAAAFARHIAES